MSVIITSTSDSPEAVTAAMGELAPEETVETPAQDTKESSETTEDSEASETNEEENSTEGDADGEDSEDENDSESEGEEELEASGEEKKKRPGGFHRRIKKLTSKLSDKEREAEYWKAEALKHAQKEDPKEEPKTEVKETSGKPKADDFETQEEWFEAVADWRVEQKLAERDQRAKATEIKSEQQKTAEAFAGRVNAFKEKHTDFDELMADVDDIPMSLTLQEVVLDSDVGPELMYELASNRKEYERICGLSTIQAAKELGVIESRLKKTPNAAPTTKTVKTTKAPEPIKPVGSKSSGTSGKTIFDPEISQHEYEALRAKQLRENRAY